MSEQKYAIYRDSFNRLRAEITDSFAIGVKLLAEDHVRRVEQNVHAYVVADILTELGPWRIRDIRVMWSPENQQYFVRYRQFRTGKLRQDRDEWLDVAGPQDRDTRAKVQEAILGVFLQIKEEAKRGVLGKFPETASKQSLGDLAPEVAAQLESLKGALDEAEKSDLAEPAQV